MRDARICNNGQSGQPCERFFIVCCEGRQFPDFNCPILVFQDNCKEIILGTDSPFKRLDHYKLHEYAKKWNVSNKMAAEPVTMTQTTSIDAMFKRKRGRPPKNRVVEVRIGLGGKLVCCSIALVALF